MIILLTAAIILRCTSTVFCSEERNASVIWDPNTEKFSIQDSIANNSVAWGYFNNSINETGWSYLEVHTVKQYNDSFQAYAAGLVEGYLTSDLMTHHWKNLYANYSASVNLKPFLESNMNFMNTQIAKNRSHPYWHQVALVLEQTQGLQDGYQNAPSFPNTNPEVMDVMFFNLFGDLFDLQYAVNKESWMNNSNSENDHCSALIKLLPNQEELYVSHASWYLYQSMLRILKKYALSYKMSALEGSEIIPGHTISFSSYPGTIFSGDDFYITSAGLVALETTIKNHNMSLYDYVQADKVVLEWIRTIVANRLSTSGLEWVSWFELYNSGTYNNQWMIVDYKKFSPGNVSQEGLLVVLEQLPSLIVYADQTNLLLNKTYWASYNIPYFPEIVNMSGNADTEKSGEVFSYDNAPRALIFKRDQGKVNDLKSMIKLMRYNDFKHDSLSKCSCLFSPYDANYAIAARNDLNRRSKANGAIDMKLTTYALHKQYEFIAYAGPTYDQQPPFQWSKSKFSDVPHEGQPDLWKFEPIIHHWLNISHEVFNYCINKTV